MSNLELLKNLLTHHEWVWYIEFKENFDKERDWKNISAISNISLLKWRDFWYMIFWVENWTKKIVWTDFKPNDFNVWNQNLHIWLSQKLSPKVFLEFIEIDYEWKNIVILKIEGAKNRPVKFDNVAYIRDGESTTNLVNYPRIEEKIWNNLKNKNFEKQICAENLSYEDVLKLLDYDKYFTLTKQNLPSETKKFVEKLSEDNLVKIQDNWKYSITVLWAILFARDIQKFDLIKRKTIRVIIYDWNDKNIRKEEIEWKKGYAVGFEWLLDYIISKIWENEEIWRALRIKKSIYPEISLREFIANSIIHQDFSITWTWPLIEIYDNRIEITNPWIPLIDVDRFMDHPPKSRNEDLASLMRRFWYCEESGSWVDRAILNIELFQLPAPKFEIFDEFTRVTLYSHRDLRNMTELDKTRACYQHCVLKYLSWEEKMTNSSLRQRFNISEKNYPMASRIIKLALDNNKIKPWEKNNEYIPYWA